MAKKILLALFSMIVLASCGGGNPEEEAKKICDCMKGAVKDESKMKDCEKQWGDLEKQFEGNKEANEKMDKVMAACEGELDNLFTSAIAEEFHNALNKKDYAKAKELATPKGQTDLNTLESMSAVATGTTPEELDKVSCEDAKEEKTTCTCKDKSGKETTYSLVKLDGKWKVDYSKMGNMSTDIPMDEVSPDTTVVE